MSLYEQDGAPYNGERIFFYEEDDALVVKVGYSDPAYIEAKDFPQFISALQNWYDNIQEK